MEQKSFDDRSNYSSLPNSPLGAGGVRDPHLWEIANRRASFKGHVATYVVMSVVFWIIWYLTGGPRYNRFVPWPVWPVLGWGVGVLFHYLGAYVYPKENSTEKEYQKLLREKSVQ